MKEIVILALSGSGVLGGGETLIMRMARWLKARNYRTIVMFGESSNFAPELTTFFNRQQIERILVPDMGGRTDIMDFTKAQAHFPKGSHIKIICIQSSFNFFAAQILKHKLPHCQVDIVHYIIHENDYCRNLSQRTSNPLILFFLRQRYCELVKRMERNGNIAYMAEAYRDHVHQTLGIGDTSIVAPIIRLGIEVRPYSDEQRRQCFHQSPFVILATARFDFPTKGFLLGLVDEFERVFVEESDAELQIIGSGQGKEELEAKAAASIAADAIRFIGEVPYEELHSYLGHANVCVCNGTGPLDATNAGTVAVVANYNTTDCLTTGYWCDDVENIGYNGTISVGEMLLKIKRMGESEYLALSRRNYETFRETYGMDVMMERLLEIENTLSTPLLSMRYLYFNKLVRLIINILTRCS